MEDGWHMKAVAANHLSKIYASGKQALNDVSFSLNEGEIYGFLGPNGSGKTTTVKLLTGILAPTQGSGIVFNLNPAAEPEKVHMLSGVVTEHAQMYNNLTGLQNLVFYSTVFGSSSDAGQKRALELLELLDLLDAKDQKLSTYSTGMRQRLSLARAMIHDPKILFLDEPTAGLDPESVQSVNNLIKTLAQDKGTTIFLCTHQLRYAEEICTGYGLISEGRMLADGSLEELRSLVFSGMTVTIRADRYPADLSAGKKDGYVEVNVHSEAEIPLVVKRIIDDGGSIYHVSARKLSLEEIYFALIERQERKE